MLPLLGGRASIHQTRCDSTQKHPRTVEIPCGGVVVYKKDAVPKGPLCEGAPPAGGGGETAILYALSLSPLRGQRPHKGSLSLLLVYIRSRQLFQTSIVRKKSVVRVIYRRCLGGGRLGGKTLDIRPQCRGGPQLAAAHSAAAVETAPAVSVCHSSSPSA